MTDNDDKDTRRAQRRAKQSETTQSPSEPSSAGEAASGEGSAPGSSGAAVPEPIRDRNARIRAEAAAERREKRERERAAGASAPVGLDASERMDDILVRTTHTVTVWLRANFKWLQWVVIGLAVGGLGWEGYAYYTRSTAAKTTDAAFLGLDAERGRVRSAEEAADESNRADTRLDGAPRFVSRDEQQTAAEDQYRKAIAAHGTSNAGWFARLGLAGVLFDQKKWDESLSLYREVRRCELAKLDGELRGRALEGMGLCLEAKKDATGALQSFRELTNQEGIGTLSTTGLYHQGRVLLSQGKKDEAKKVLLDAKKRILPEDAKPEQQKAAPSYLSKAVGRLLSEIDPSLAAGLSDTPSFADLLSSDPSRLQKMLERMGKNSPPPVEAPTAPPPPIQKPEEPSAPPGEGQ